MRTLNRDLCTVSAGTARRLACHVFGPGAGAPVVYMQAGLHADEMPGVLVLQHLLPLLAEAEARGAVSGQVRLVPFANPIGLAQWAHGRPLGRHDADSLRNFNRYYPELAKLSGDALEGRLTADPDENRRLIRAAFREALAGAEARTEAEEMRVALLGWSCDADYVLDLHCDHEAVMHLYASPAQPEVTSLLCRSVGAKLALIEAVSGGNAFDEAHTAPWLKLRERFGDRHPIPAACFSTTLEYRGQFDVDDALARADARNLMTFLGAIGVIRDWPDAPAHDDPAHLPLASAAEVFAPAGGVVTWIARPGAVVAEGEVLGHVTDPASGTRHPVRAPVTGMMFRHELWRSCLKGQGLAHVAGETPVRTGDLLSD
jgi:predicted deacylase